MSAAATASGRHATTRPARHFRQISGRSPARQYPGQRPCQLTRSVRYQTGFGISLAAGPGFLVTEVSCGCRQRYYLALHSLITQAVAAARGPGGRGGRVHVPPLPADLPERAPERTRLFFQCSA